MNREGHHNIKFFIGPEVEHTPAFSKKTLFVVGKQSLNEILKHASDSSAVHVYMGANHSFDPADTDSYWNDTIIKLLEKGLWVSLDYQSHYHAQVTGMLAKRVWQNRMFVPILSVRIPHFATSSANLTVKIDDVGFDETNDGVWCFAFKELMDSNRFTGWTEYKSDVKIDTGADADASIVSEVPVKQTTAVAKKPVIVEEEKPTEPVKLNNPELGIDPVPVPVPSETEPDPAQAGIVPADDTTAEKPPVKETKRKATKR